MSESPKFDYFREYWSGHSRDGKVVDTDGYHYLIINEKGKILDAIEWYESEGGEEIVTSLPEMINVNWLKDLGYEDFDSLELVEKEEFDRFKEMVLKKRGDKD